MSDRHAAHDWLLRLAELVTSHSICKHSAFFVISLSGYYLLLCGEEMLHLEYLMYRYVVFVTQLLYFVVM